MSSPVRLKGYGTTLGYADTVGGSYTTLTGMSKIDPGKPKSARTMTHDLAQATQVKTSQAGWIDPGEAKGVGYFDQTQYAALLALFTGRTEKFWKVTLPLASGQVTAAKETFPGYVADIGVPEISNEDENLVMVEFTLQLNDVPTFTAGS